MYTGECMHGGVHYGAHSYFEKKSVSFLSPAFETRSTLGFFLVPSSFTGKSSSRELERGGAVGGRPDLIERAGEAFSNCDCDDSAEASTKCSRIKKLSHAFRAASTCDSCLTYSRKYLKWEHQTTKNKETHCN